MAEPLIEPIFDDKSENAVDKSENVENSVENEPKVTKKGRPSGSKDKIKRVVKPRKITIVEEPLHVDAPEAPVVMKTPRPKAVSIAPEPEVRYVDRYIEHSPRSLIRHAHSHIMNERNSKHDARRDRFSDMILRSLR